MRWRFKEGQDSDGRNDDRVNLDGVHVVNQFAGIGLHRHVDHIVVRHTRCGDVHYDDRVDCDCRDVQHVNSRRSVNVDVSADNRGQQQLCLRIQHLLAR
jgi:hypothetical protein